MKRMRCIVGFLIMVGLSACVDTKKEHKKELAPKNIPLTEAAFVNRIQDFGVLPQDTTVSAEFYFKNTGKNKLIVDYVNPDCTCTGYELSKDTIAVGDSAFIRLDFNTKHKYGKQKIYTIVSMNTREELYKLMFTADVR